MEKQKNIPELRFSEFNGEWKERNLGDLSRWYSGGTPSKKEQQYWDGDIPWISASSMQGIEYGDSELKISNEGLKSGSRLAHKGWLLILVRGSMLFNKIPIGIATKDVAFNQDVKGIEVNSNSDALYIMYYLYSKESKLLSIVTGTGIGAGKLDLDDLKTFKTPIPSIPEQQKIASFFTAIDKKISQLKQKKTLLEQYKKGVMQKIFSQDIRFRDDNGQEFPEWEKKRLGKIGNTFNGLTGKTKEDFSSGKPYVQYKQIFDDSRIDVNRFGFVNIMDGEKQNKVEYGDIFFTTSSETPDEVGTSSVLLHHIDGLYLNSFCFGYRTNHEILHPEFSRYLFRSELLRKEIVKLAQGSTRYNMSKNELMKIKVKLPTIHEQMKIAGFLSAIDNKIDNTQTQIEKAELWKKGLLQKMFV